MALSKPIFSMVGFYLEQVDAHPLLVKSITAGVLSAGANYISQRLATDDVDPNSLFAYGMFGLVFGGSVPHYFYGFMEKLTRGMRNKRMLQFFMQRLMFTPVFTAISLLFLTVFEGGSTEQALRNLFGLYQKVLYANWKYLTLPVYINFKYVHPVLRVLATNVIGVFWTIYLANKRRAANKKRADAEAKKRAKNQ